MDYGIIKSVSFYDFCDSFSEGYKNNFTYEGKRALFDYLEQYANDIGENVELDTVALCCEYSEYSNAVECQGDKQYRFDYELEGIEPEDIEKEKEKQALKYLQDNTSVIEFDKGIIIQDF